MSTDVPGANAPPPSDPALKAAKIAVFILSALIILALIGLVVGAAMKLAKPHAPVVAPSQPAGSLFMLPMGARVLEMQTQPGRLILHLRTTDGEEIDILDTADGHLVSRIKAVQ